MDDDKPLLLNMLFPKPTYKRWWPVGLPGKNWKIPADLPAKWCNKNRWVFPKNSGKTPNHPVFHRVFHYFHHPLWGTVALFLVQHPDGTWSNHHTQTSKVRLQTTGFFRCKGTCKVQSICSFSRHFTGNILRVSTFETYRGKFGGPGVVFKDYIS